MRTHYKLILLSFVTMMVMTVSGCRNDKKTSDIISQQQDFPEREININASDTHEVEVADSIEPQDHVAQAVQAVEQAAHASHSSRSNSSRMTLPVSTTSTIMSMTRPRIMTTIIRSDGSTCRHRW